MAIDPETMANTKVTARIEYDNGAVTVKEDMSWLRLSEVINESKVSRCVITRIVKA